MTTANKVEFSIDDGETWSEEIEMVAGANTYSPEIGGVTYPVSLTFTADTGHTAGDEWELAYSDAGSTGTFAGTALKVTEATGGRQLEGYTPTDIGGELNNIQNAANDAGQFIYAWDFGASLRVPETQQIAVAWALAQQFAIMGTVSNDLSAPTAGYEADIGYLLENTNNNHDFLFWHDQAKFYPVSSVFALMLNVDYNLQDSTITAKFKGMPGIPPSKVTPTTLAVLESKGYNLYTAMQGGVNVVREGNVNQAGWYLDDRVNMDNFVNELQTALYNVFVRNNKVANTPAGSAKMVSAAVGICEKYKRNGTFADRDILDTASESGYITAPAYTVTPTPFRLQTASQRASRTGPPLSILVYMAGAQHSIAVNVSMVQ